MISPFVNRSSSCYNIHFSGTCSSVFEIESEFLCKDIEKFKDNISFSDFIDFIMLTVDNAMDNMKSPVVKLFKLLYNRNTIVTRDDNKVKIKEVVNVCPIFCNMKGNIAIHIRFVYGCENLNLKMKNIEGDYPFLTDNIAESCKNIKLCDDVNHFKWMVNYFGFNDRINKIYILTNDSYVLLENTDPKDLIVNSDNYKLICFI